MVCRDDWSTEALIWCIECRIDECYSLDFTYSAAHMTRVLIVFVILSTHMREITTARVAEFWESGVKSVYSLRNLCGFKFALVENMVVVAKPIQEKTLRNKVDNERYNACSYIVEISYKGISVPVDFSRDITLQRIREIEQHETVTAAFFRYSADGWAAAGDDITIAPTDITTHEKANSLAVSGIVHRKNQETKKEDFCFSLEVIGEEKYLTGAVCRPTKAELEPLRALFSKKSIVWAER